MSNVRPVVSFLLLWGAIRAIVGCAADPGDALKARVSGGLAGDSGTVFPEAGGIVDSGLGAGDSAMIDPDGGAPIDSAPPSETGPTDAAAERGAPPPPPPPMDAAPDVVTCSNCPLVVQYMTPTTSVTTQDIRPHLQIVNNGTSAQDLTALTLRYYFTAEGSQSQAFNCDYTALAGNCATLQGTFVAMQTPTSTADHYLEVSFTGDSIGPGQSTGEMQLRFNDTGYAVTFTQTNDYSFNAGDASSYAPWDHVTLYRNGTLVWGIEP